VKAEMTKAKLDVLGVCETRWAGKGAYTAEEFRVINSDNEKSGKKWSRNSVKKLLENNVTNLHHVNDRILTIKMQENSVLVTGTIEAIAWWNSAIVTNIFNEVPDCRCYTWKAT